MLNKRLILLIIIVFGFGWFCSAAFSEASELISHYNFEVGTPERIKQTDDSFLNSFFVQSREQISPHNWIEEKDIHVTEDRVVIDVEDARWATFTDTNSMDPVIDEDSNAIEIIPQTEEDIHVGDIIAYKSEYAEGTIIHRVVEISEDEDGWYAIARGDNNTFDDPGKIRFNQIKRVLVAIIY